MKNKYLIIWTLFFITTGSSIAQEENQIDPRQYVKVLYSKDANSPRRDTLWMWETNSGLLKPNQKIKIIDSNGLINIEFNKEDIVSNELFEGVVSLEAELSGSNGMRKIEVNPYSEIGIERRPIGVKSDPPRELVKRLLNLILELENVTNSYGIYVYNVIDAYTRKDQIDKTISLFDSVISVKDTVKVVEYANQLGSIGLQEVNSYYNDSKDDVLRLTKYSYGEIDFNQIRRNVYELKSIFDDYYIRLYLDFKQQFTTETKDLIFKLEIALSYLNAFEGSGEDAMKAVLKLINKDLINYKYLKEGLVGSLNELKTIGTSDENFESLIKSSSKVNESLRRVSKSFNFSGSILYDAISDELQNERAKLDSVTNYTDTLSRFYQNNPSILYESLMYKVIRDNFDDITESLSEIAGREIFKRLVYATVDLGNSGANEGEVLNLYLTWILDSKKDSLGNSPRLPIGKYYIRKTGWSSEVTDMFSLVKRIDENKFDSTKLSPSNFKGSGGAVLMWTYREEDRGLKEKVRSDGEKYFVKRKAFVNFIEPSFGVNISYLDFDTTKDVEIGTGLQMGLFRNKIFFGYGLNLHMLRPEDSSPGYFYVGFSFAKISDLFQNSGSVGVN